jgi:hypothetical protein
MTLHSARNSFRVPKWVATRWDASWARINPTVWSVLPCKTRCIFPSWCIFFGDRIIGIHQRPLFIYVPFMTHVVCPVWYSIFFHLHYLVVVINDHKTHSSYLNKYYDNSNGNNVINPLIKYYHLYYSILYYHWLTG